MLRSWSLPLQRLLVFSLIISYALPVSGHGTGAPQSACLTLQPSPIYHGSPQDTKISQPPAVLKVTDQTGLIVRSYKEEVSNKQKNVYTVKITSNVAFKGFVLQARVVSSDAELPKRVGKFIQDESWSSQGVQFQSCQDGVNDSITHTDSRYRSSLVVKWHSTEALRPIQFTMTIVQNQTHFWSRWAPPNGRLNPEQDQAERQAEPVDEDTDTHRNSESRQHLPKSARIQSRVKDPDFNIDSVLPGDFSGGRRPTAATTETVTKAGDSTSPCTGSPCRNGGICHAASGGGFRCECDSGWAGPFCEKSCPSSTCQNGGTCVLDAGGSTGCHCPPGYTGSSCGTDINECASNPCLNGGSCTDRVNGFWCTCKTGYTGQRCHRPCQNVYKSCERWKEEDRCENMRKLTKFFDANCPVACDQCSFDNATIVDFPPFPPALEPFHFLLGNWVGRATTRDHFPLDFDSSTGSNGYSEEINFEVAEVPMFGTPSVNYSCISKSFGNPTDMQIITGYLTLKRSPGTTKQAALLTTSNNGIIMIEEGAVSEGVSVELKSVFNATMGYLKYRVPKESTRLFIIDGNFLRVKTNLVDYEGRTREFYTFYNRIKGRNLY